MQRSPHRTEVCRKSAPGYHFSCSQGALSHLGRQGVCFPLILFIS